MPTFREEPWESDRRAREDRAGLAGAAPSREVASYKPSAAPGAVWSKGAVDRHFKSRSSGQLARLRVIVLVGLLSVVVALTLASVANHVR